MQTFQNLLLQNCGTEFLDIVKFDNNNILFAKKNHGQTSWPNFHSPPPPISSGDFYSVGIQSLLLAGICFKY